MSAVGRKRTFARVLVTQDVIAHPRPVCFQVLQLSRPTLFGSRFPFGGRRHWIEADKQSEISQMPLKERVGQTAKASDAAEYAGEYQLLLGFDDARPSGDDIEPDASRGGRYLAGVVRNAKPNSKAVPHTLEIDSATRA